MGIARFGTSRVLCTNAMSLSFTSLYDINRSTLIFVHSNGKRYCSKSLGSATSPAGIGTGTTTPQDSEKKEQTNETALENENVEAWLNDRVDLSVKRGRQSPKAAEYFKNMLKKRPEFSQFAKEARRLFDGQDPDQLTRFQQTQWSNRLSQYSSGVASGKLMQAHSEESSLKRHTQEGSPTGENYWFEAGNTLASPGVPGFLKDEILKDMQNERKKDSPAFQKPSEDDIKIKSDEK